MRLKVEVWWRPGNEAEVEVCWPAEVNIWELG